MTNVFLKNEFPDLFNTISESNVSLPKWISIVDKANNTSQLSATSSATVGQKGGTFSATSNYGASDQDVNKLLSMITSESSNSNFKGLSETSTASLENQLRSALNQQQNGGSKNNNISANDIRQFFTTLKSQGVDVNIKLNDQTFSEFFGSSFMTGGQNQLLEETTTTELPFDNATFKQMVAGAGKNKKAQDAGANPGFKAFLDLKKFIAIKLGVSNGPKVGKVAGAVQKDIKASHPDWDSVKVSEEGKKLFVEKMDHYKQMLPK